MPFSEGEARDSSFCAIESDQATCVAYLQAQHDNPGGMWTVGGYYTNTLVRTPEGWKISKLKLTATWSQNS